MIPEHGTHRVKEVAMTRRLRLWITAVLTMAATALMVGLAVAAQAGVHQAHPPTPPVAGITFNGLD
jgi:thiol:disulfide interchange protein